MRKIQIAFDLDGCLIDLMSIIKSMLFDLYGAKIIDDTKWRLETDIGISNNKIWKAVRLAYQKIDEIEIYPGVTELLTKLYEKTREPPLILTARPFDAANYTYEIVKRIMNKTPFALILKHDFCHKADYLQGYHWFVEDRKRTACELSELGFQVPLVKKSYNQFDVFNSRTHTRYKNIYFIDGVHELIPDIKDFIL